MTRRIPTAQRKRTVTFEEFCVVVPEDQKADLIDGVIYVASPENLEANDLFMWLGSLIRDYVEEKNLGQVYGSRVAFRLDDHSAPEPDIAFVKAERLHLAQRGFFRGPADLAIEIVSPESVERDYEQKRAKYEAAGFTEYWIIDEELQTIKLLRLDSAGKYREIKAKKGELHSQVIQGFWLRPEWVLQQPRPKKSAILQLILASKG